MKLQGLIMGSGALTRESHFHKFAFLVQVVDVLWHRMLFSETPACRMLPLKDRHFIKVSVLKQEWTRFELVNLRMRNRVSFRVSHSLSS